MDSLIDSKHCIHISEHIVIIIQQITSSETKYLPLLGIKFKFYYLFFYSVIVNYLYCNLFDIYNLLHFDIQFMLFKNSI